MNNNALYRAMCGGYWGLFPDGWQQVTKEIYASCMYHNTRPAEDNTDIYIACRLFVALTAGSFAFVVWWF